MTPQEIENRISQLEKKVSEQDKRLLELEKKPNPYPEGGEFVDYEGATFQKKIGGGYRKIILCIRCKNPMTPIAERSHFMCFECKHTAEFPGKDLAAVIDSLPE